MRFASMARRLDRGGTLQAAQKGTVGAASGTSMAAGEVRVPVLERVRLRPKVAVHIESRPGPSRQSVAGRAWSLSERKVLLMVGDLLIVTGSNLAPQVIEGMLAGLAHMMVVWTLSLASVWVVVAQALGCYDLAVAARPGKALRRVSAAAGLTLAIYWLVPYWFSPLPPARSLVVIQVVTLFGLLAALRLAYTLLLVRPRFRMRTLLVGRDATAAAVRVLLDGQAGSECELVAQIDTDEVAALCPTVSGFVDFVRSNRIHEVIVSPATGLTTELQIALAELAEEGVTISTSSEVYEYLCGRVPVPVADPLWVATLPPSPNVYTVLRRFADVLVGAAGLLLFLPVLLCVSAAISLESPGWPLYRQERVGRHGRPFRIVKLRSMVQDAEPDGHAVWARPGDSRTTRVGSLLRRTRLDEVPQLWNVLLGEMSLIGPRPERPEFVEMLTSAVPMYRARHMVAPGITGWAQVSYRYGSSLEDSVRKLEYDLYYVRHRSLLLDAVIVLQTVGVVLLRRGS